MLEAKGPVNLLQTHAGGEVQLQIAVVEAVSRLCLQQIYLRDIFVLLAAPEDDNTFIPAKDIDDKAVPPLNFLDLGDGCGGIDTIEIKAICCVIPGRYVYLVSGRKQGWSDGPMEALVILVLHVYDRLLVSHCRW